MKKEKLTMSAMDRMIYNYLVVYISHYMCSPTIRNIGKATGLSSTSSVYAHLNRLERMGFIERIYDSNKSAVRNIRLVGYKIVKCEEAMSDDNKIESIS